MAATQKRVKRKTRKGLLVGITGGIGAGKSTVANVFRELGYLVLSADEIAREIVSPGAPALKEIRRVFGPPSLHADGSLNRPWLREKIAENPKLRRRLEAITHPRIQRRALQLTRAAWAKGASIVFYEAPLLFEAKSARKMDKVICVHADDETRIARVLARDGGKRPTVAKLLKSQLPQKTKMRLSDFLIENNGSRSDLRRRALVFLGELAP